MSKDTQNDLPQSLQDVAHIVALRATIRRLVEAIGPSPYRSARECAAVNEAEQVLRQTE